MYFLKNWKCILFTLEVIDCRRERKVTSLCEGIAYRFRLRAENFDERCREDCNCSEAGPFLAYRTLMNSP